MKRGMKLAHIFSTELDPGPTLYETVHDAAGHEHVRLPSDGQLHVTIVGDTRVLKVLHEELDRRLNLIFDPEKIK